MFRPETDWLSKWATYTPGRRFLRDHGTDREWTFGEAHARVESVARWITDELGLARGDRLAVLSTNRVETVFVFLACVRTGVILVPLNFRLTAPELAQLLDDCAPGVTLVEDGLADRVTGREGVRAITDVTPMIFAAKAPTVESVRAPAALDDVVMILYTSGTTGVPKGAMITHRMLLWNAMNTGLRLAITERDHTQSYAPFFHTGGWNVLFTPFLLHGASHTILSGFDADLVLRLMEDEGTTLLFGVPTMLQMMAECERFDATDLSACRYAIVGGAPMPLPLIDDWHAKGVAIRQGYGLTEVGPNCYSLDEDEAIRKRGSIGRPNFFLDVRIVDDEGRDCGVDEVGELWLRGETVTPGYWRNEEATREAITADGWFRTGDLVKCDDEGFTSVVDRKKNMFISGGENVYPAEVERVLGTHEAVRDVAVIGVPDDRWGEVGHAFVEVHEGSAFDLETLRAFCDGKLARYKIPRHVSVIASIPRNAAGKVNAAALRSLA